MIWHILPLLDYVCWQQTSGWHDGEMGRWDVQVTRTSIASSVINTTQKGTLTSTPSASDSIGCSTAFLRVLTYGKVSWWRRRGKTNYPCIPCHLSGLCIRSGLLVGRSLGVNLGSIGWMRGSDLTAWMCSCRHFQEYSNNHEDRWNISWELEVFSMVWLTWSQTRQYW